MNCIYRYKDKIFNSEAELDDFLLEKFGYESKFGDLIFNKTTNFLRTKDIIENLIIKKSEKLQLQMKIRNARLKAAYLNEEEVLNFDPPYIGVNRFLLNARYNGNRIFPEFIPENYWDKRKESWQNPLEDGEDITKRFSDDEIEIFFNINPTTGKPDLHLLSDEEAEHLELLMTKKWEFQAAAGSAVHYVLQQCFSKVTIDGKEVFVGDLSREEKIDLIKSKIDKDLSESLGNKYSKFKNTLINDNVIEQAIDYALDLKIALRKKHGEGCEFYPELSVSSTLNTSTINPDTPETILGIIDLLVVDNKGQTHIYDYKSSPKPFDKFDSAKKRAYQFLLAMYGKILKKYGIEYRNSDISILPIQFDDLKLNNPEEARSNVKKALFSYKGIIPKPGFFETETRNKIFEVNTRGEEKIIQILDDYLPKEIIYNVSSENMISEIIEAEGQWFPDYIKYKAKSRDEIKQLLEKEGALKPIEKEGKQVYSYLSRGAYAKEIVANSPEELIDKVLKQLEKIEKRSEYFANTVERALKYSNEKSTRDIGEMISSIDTKQISNPNAFAKWFESKLGIYCNGNWDLVKIDALKPLGIITLKNKTTGQIDIIKLSSSNVLYNPFENETKENGKRVKRRNHLLSYALLSDINEISNSKSLMLDGYKGNIELMEVLLALNNIPDLCESGAVIGNINVMNPFQGNGISASNELIMYSFLKMSQLSPLKGTNNIKEGKIKLATTFDLAVNSFNEAMMTDWEYQIDSSQFNSAKSDLDRIVKNGNNEEKIEAIYKIMLLMEKAHPELVNETLRRETLLEKPYARLYYELLQAYRYLNGVNLKQQIKDHDKWTEEKSFMGIIKKGLAGTMTDNPGNMLSDTLNTVAKLVAQAYQNIRNNMTSKVALLRNATEELKKDRGFIGIQERLGNATDMYKNMTKEVNGDLMFTDIHSKELSNAERKYLELVLEIINENRFGGKKSKKELEKMKNSYDPDYYRVPLCTATAESRDSVIGLHNGLLERLKKFHPKTALADVRAKVDGIFMEEDVENYNKASELFTMNNRFDRSERDIDYRKEAITKNGIGYFERNLEVLTLKHCYSYISAKELNKVFPIIKASLGFLAHMGNAVNDTFVKDTEYLINYVKNSIKGQPIEETEGMRKTTAMTSRIKQIASFMALAFSPVQGAYQTIQGLWLDISLIIRKPDGTHAFTFKNMYDAAKEVYSDLFKSSYKPTKCSLINEWLGVNDMDMNIYADKMRLDLKNKYNFVNFAFKFTSRPDFYNRMTIIVAKMKADGIWDALEVKDGKLVYNFKKDKRFEVLNSGNTSDPRYNDQLALYHTIAQQFITENVSYPDGKPFQMPKDLTKPTPLPYAWTNQEAESIKSLCDLIYGYYSHEKKSLIHATFLGSLYMQMKTYWSGKKNQYLQPGGVRLQGKWEQAIDPESGKPLYYLTDSNGIIDFDAKLTTNPTSAPFYQWKGKYLEGIILTISNMLSYGILSKEGLKQGFEETFNNEDINVRQARIANMKQFGTDLLFYLIIGMGIAGWLLADWDKELQKEAKESGEFSDALKSSLAHLTRLSFGQSAEDFNWWMSIGNPAVNWSPFSFTQATNTTKKLYNSLFGDSSFYDGVTKSFAVGKQMKPLVDWLNPRNFSSES